jgi:hypothetical protein
MKQGRTCSHDSCPRLAVIRCQHAYLLSVRLTDRLPAGITMNEVRPRPAIEPPRQVRP